ncbi:molybdopterin-guanine dinucleotide biosynthesis protein B [Rubeoparvulum massiliense]|uniref:molybdopterin-guanine dinucleotide biosynthesis protein B n=1 Tax=Rubeoparvulum massiliense TaxID=1631346 RepID=UPI00065E964F|nr:molybdopterin-guanine dinucleotide biosynthesis protein B [Rubeoparvulum massiliense]
MDIGKPILQVVGYKDSGKTTLIVKVIHACNMEGWRVATLKHHGHGGRPFIHDNGTDTAKHRNAGAIVTGVEGNGTFILQINAEESISFEHLLKFYRCLDVDFVLVEGYKEGAYPKLMLVREEEEFCVASKLENLQAIISWVPLDKITSVAYQELKERIPIFHIDDEQAYLTWMIEIIAKKVDQNENRSNNA